MGYEEIELDELKKIVQNDIALIVTATDTETEATHKKFSPLNGYSNILQAYDESNTYYGGFFGKYRVIHVQSNMGAVGRDSAIMTISNAIRTLSPKFVIMIGIAFGIDDEKQKIGDVLVAEGILPYDNKRVGNTTIQRGQQAPSSKILLNRFKAIRTWQYLINDSILAEKIITPILSGEELIDNINRRNELVKEFPTSKGGEMEGAGLFAACDGSVDWILVKGICDFADGNKGQNKKQNQETAINSALSLCLELFNSSYAFSALGLYPLKEKEDAVCSCNHQLADEILFEVYNKSNEKYYVAREHDNAFSKILDQYCIWVHGISGCGKTNLIFRNLILNKFNYTPVSLASCIELDVIELFKEILFDIESNFGKLQNPLNNNTFSNICRNILSLLEQYCTETEHVILIEEIPISSENDYKEFVSHFFSLLILKKLKHGLNKVKFVLSSIKNPTVHIKPTHQKIHQQVKFIELENWNTEDIDNLIQLICNELDLKLSKELVDKLKDSSNNSPRFVKKFFRNVLACCITDEVNYENILAETERELKQFYHG
jgi:nucleoside phosphorylase